MSKTLERAWEKERDNRYTFHVICKTKMKNLCKIYPLNQKKVNAIFEAIHDDDRINMVVVFGSSLNLRCNSDSDIDLAVKLKPGYITNNVKDEVSEKIQVACDWKADILWRDRMADTEPILVDIRKGVILE